MSALIEIQNGEAVTTSLAIAEGTAVEHKAVIQLVRTHVSDLEQFGLVAFEMRPRSATDLDKAAKLNPTEIGKRLTPRLSAVKVNKILIDIGMQRKVENGNVLTDAGTEFGESRPFQANNAHVGDQIHWYESIVKKIETELSRPPVAPQPTLI